MRLVGLDREKHFANAMIWLNDPEVTEFLKIGDFPIGAVAESAYFDRATGEITNNISFAVETLEGKHIGFSGLHAIDFRNGFATSGTVLGAKEIWGKGYGTDAARVRACYAFEVLGLRMLLSGAFEGNERSLKMQEKVGYKVYGRCPKKFWKRGQYRDLIQTVLTREDWEAARAK